MKINKDVTIDKSCGIHDLSRCFSQVSQWNMLAMRDALRIGTTLARLGRSSSITPGRQGTARVDAKPLAKLSRILRPSLKRFLLYLQIPVLRKFTSSLQSYIAKLQLMLKTPTLTSRSYGPGWLANEQIAVGIRGALHIGAYLWRERR